MVGEKGDAIEDNVPEETLVALLLVALVEINMTGGEAVQDVTMLMQLLKRTLMTTPMLRS